MSEIKKTKRYDIFIMHESNRKIDQFNLDKIKKSIQLNNMLEFRPIMCNPKMQVLDGQHRLIAARDLDVEIYYQIKEDAVDEDMILLNNAQKRWSMGDYVAYHASKGNEGYIEFNKFVDRNKVSCHIALSLLGVERGGKTLDKMKKGTINLPPKSVIAETEALIKDAREILAEIRRCSHKKDLFLKGDRPLLALIALSRLDGYNKNEMKESCLKRMDVILPKSTIESYYKMFIEIYNYGKKTRRLD